MCDHEPMLYLLHSFFFFFNPFFLKSCLFLFALFMNVSPISTSLSTFNTFTEVLEMALIVFVHKRHQGKRIHCETASEATGVAGVMPNKGGFLGRDYSHDL